MIGATACAETPAFPDPPRKASSSAASIVTRIRLWDMVSSKRGEFQVEYERFARGQPQDGGRIFSWRQSKQHDVGVSVGISGVPSVAVGVGVRVSVGANVLVRVTVGLRVAVRVKVRAGLRVAVRVKAGLLVFVAVGLLVFVAVGLLVLVAVGLMTPSAEACSE